jgi:threonine/homoserine/homoserine lactone efflux protein
MVAASSLIAFVAIAVPIILVPGPSVLFVIGRSLSLGRIGGLLSVVGNAAGALLIVLAVAFGLGLVIAQSLILFTVIKVAGAAYLIYLGIQAIAHRRARGEAITGTAALKPRWKLLIQGFLVGASNPKTIVFFVAVLPQFVDYGAGGIRWQMLELGIVFVTIALVTDSVWALAGGVARDWFARSPRRISTLGATGGVFMIGLGLASLFVGQGRK